MRRKLHSQDGIPCRSEIVFGALQGEADAFARGGIVLDGEEAFIPEDLDVRNLRVQVLGNIKVNRRRASGPGEGAWEGYRRKPQNPCWGNPVDLEQYLPPRASGISSFQNLQGPSIRGQRETRPSMLKRVRILLIAAFNKLKTIKQRWTKVDSDTQYRRFFEAAEDGSLIVDAETGWIVDVNPSLSELLKLPRKRFIGETIWGLEFFNVIVPSKENVSTRGQLLKLKLEIAGEIY